MVLMVGDQVKTVLFHTSGTNVNTTGTGFWVGQVTSVSVDESESYEMVRYAGTATRDVSQINQGAKTFAGTVNYNVQDWRMLKYALGSCVDAGSPSPYSHTFIGTNNNDSCPEVGGDSLPAFNMELSKSVLVAASGLNFVRNLYGCFVDTFTVSSNEGENIKAEVGYVARNGSFASGATTAVTEDTTREFFWSDSQFQLPSGTIVNNIKSWSIAVNNNLVSPLYTNNTRFIGTPIPTNREMTINWTLNADTSVGKAFYDQYFKGGSSFNLTFDSTASAGSRTVFIAWSGCKITAMNTPDVVSEVQEFNITITPKTVSAVEQSLTFKYNAE